MKVTQMNEGFVIHTTDHLPLLSW